MGSAPGPGAKDCQRAQGARCRNAFESFSPNARARMLEKNDRNFPPELIDNVTVRCKLGVLALIV